MISFNTPTTHLLFFGKIPSRGDFVRTSKSGSIIKVFDEWVSGAMEELVNDPRWKTIYDEHGYIDFAFFSSHDNQSRHLVAGTLGFSRDNSSRRFPFICAASSEMLGAEGKLFTTLPLYLPQIWSQTRDGVISGMLQREDSGNQFSEAVVNLNPMLSATLSDHAAFMETTSVDSLQQLLASAHPSINFKQAVLAVGLLLQPVLSNRGAVLNKGLFLPLPEDVYFQPLVSAFWLGLISGFANSMTAEFCLLNKPSFPASLCVGFNGASSKALHTLMSQEKTDYRIDVTQAEWTEQFIESNYGLRKLTTYLEHPQLSLSKLKETFNEVFMGN